MAKITIDKVSVEAMLSTMRMLKKSESEYSRCMADGIEVCLDVLGLLKKEDKDDRSE